VKEEIAKIKIGCCGFPVGRKKYYENFSLVEINSTFYQIPNILLAEKWRSEAPKNFEFTMKAWQLITHEPSSTTYRRLKDKIPEKKKKNYGFFRPTEEVFSAWERTLEFAKILKASIVIFQCPPSFKPTEENKKNMKKFFSQITKSPSPHTKKWCGASPVTLIWEPRGEWKPEEIKELCRELNLIHCTNPLESMPIYGKIGYFRLHGVRVGNRINYNYEYTDEELKKLIGLCDKKVNYCLFNNLKMYNDALKFQQIVTREFNPW